jgi:Pvc16 N-terminal domain
VSDYRAISGVSRSLRSLLLDRMEVPVGVTIAPPDVTVDDLSDSEWLNLYLYQVTENGYLKNQEIPGHGNPGAYGHPPLSLNLYYLLTVRGRSETGEDSDLQAQQTLGDAMRVLHDFPVITDRLQLTRSSPGGSVGDNILDTSLLGEFERIKITLEPVNLEDLSKIWTALPQTNFRRSVAYMVSVVQIESQRPGRFPRPVGEPPPAGPRVFAVPFRSPRITDIRVRRPGDPPDAERAFAYARIDDTLILGGHNFASNTTRVTLGGVDVTAQITLLRDDRIEVTVPDDDALQPGPQPVKVVLDVMMGDPPESHLGFQSNLTVFMLVPRISSLTQDTSTVPRTLRIQGKRLFLGTLGGETLVGPVLIPKSAYRAVQPAEITVALPDTLPARSVRCLVSGDLSTFPSLPTAPEVRLTIGADAPRRAVFASSPATLPDAAGILQAAIRSAPDGGASFRGTRVTTAANRLAVVPGGLASNVTVFAGDTANRLKLTGGTGGTTSQGYLSGELAPFPSLTSTNPAVRLTVGGTGGTVTLASRPATLANAASLLETAIRGAGFSSARVTTLGNQLLILPFATGTVTFDGVPGTDEITVAELQLRASYPVRVRVNGAESIDERELEMP